jgi:hypothetical protein
LKQPLAQTSLLIRCESKKYISSRELKPASLNKLSSSASRNQRNTSHQEN